MVKNSLIVNVQLIDSDLLPEFVRKKRISRLDRKSRSRTRYRQDIRNDRRSENYFVYALRDRMRIKRSFCVISRPLPGPIGMKVFQVRGTGQTVARGVVIGKRPNIQKDLGLLVRSTRASRGEDVDV